MGLWETRISRYTFNRGVVTGAAVVALAPIAVAAEQRQADLSKETDSLRPITFQPGIHPTTDDEFKTIWNNLYTHGYIRPSIWNQEVAERVGKVSILAGDGASPSDDPTDEEKVLAWELLPDRPSKISASGNKVLFLRGDTYYSTITGSFPTADIKRIKEAAFENLANRDESSAPLSLEVQAAYAKEAGVVALAVVSAALLLNKALHRSGSSGEPTRPFSRRALIRKGLGFGGATVLTMSGLTGLFNQAIPAAAISPVDGLRKFFEIMSEAPVLDLHDQSSLYLNARTALLYTKLEDAMDDLDLPQDARAAIVMGDGHLVGARDVLNSRTLRTKLIREYAKLMIHLVKQMVGNTVDDETIRISVTEQLAKYDVLEITDPGIVGDVDKGFAGRISEYVKPYPSKNWGSRQVIKALQGLY